MTMTVRAAELGEIETLRARYREEMSCRIIHDSIHARAGWSEEFAFEDDGSVIGYGSVAVGGPWRENHAIYEFFLETERRRRSFETFMEFAQVCAAQKSRRKATTST